MMIIIVIFMMLILTIRIPIEIILIIEWPSNVQRSGVWAHSPG